MSLSQMKGLTDSLGGVTVDNGPPEGKAAYAFPAGKQKLKGAQAMAFMHAGAAGIPGSIQHARAQEAYFRGVLSEVLTARTLLDPVRTTAAVSFLAPHLNVDQGFDAAYVAGLGLSLRELRTRDVLFFRLPAGPPTRLAGTTVEYLDETALAQTRRHLREDTPLVG
jgi:hypothetical protein